MFFEKKIQSFFEKQYDKAKCGSCQGSSRTVYIFEIEEAVEDKLSCGYFTWVRS
jgi:hypothetical protein